MDLKPFLELTTLFAQHGFRLWMIGGTSRDYLLHLAVEDYDFTTDATPEQMKPFLPHANYRFARYGTVMLEAGGYQVDITTLRQESLYHDKRHPEAIVFVKEPQADYLRRDLTINALYLDAALIPLDFTTGLDDLKTQTLRMIGDPFARLNEDPLRILRVLRFQHRLGFHQEPTLAKAMNQSLSLLENLNPSKIAEEIKKMMVVRPHEASLLLASYGIHPHGE